MLNGVDIANWQSGLRIANIDADFVICKATEGVGYTDPTFENFMRQAISAGRLVGAYHFARSTTTAEQQADWFARVVGPYVGRAMLFLDWENAEPYDMRTLDQGPSWAKRWLDRVRELTGSTPMIYTSKSVCHEYDFSAVARTYGLWGAQYASNNPVYGYKDKPWQSADGWGAWGGRPTIFQYTGELVLQGYPKRLDGNIAYMTRDEWTKRAGGKTPDVPEPPEGDRLEVDGWWGPATTTALQEHFKTTVDGIVSHQWPSTAQPACSRASWEYDRTGKGSQLVRAMQRALGVHEDGLMGPTTINALQRHMGTTVDGVLSGPSLCVMEMQRRLNKGMF